VDEVITGSNEGQFVNAVGADLREAGSRGEAIADALAT